MAWDLFKFFRTGNGNVDEPKPKPKPTPAPSPQSASRVLGQGFARGSGSPGPVPAPTPQANPAQNVWGTSPGGSSRSGRSGGQTWEPPKQEEQKPNFLEEMGKGQVQQAEQKQGVAEDIFNWLINDKVEKPGDFFQPIGGTTDRIEKKEAEEQAAVQARADWGTGLGGGNTEVKELTWDEYDALTPRQRAAVDANSMLVTAIEQDMSTGALAADQKDDAYQQSLEALFGKEGGSDTYAPATVSALSQLGLANTEVGDLDEYLNRNALVNTTDLGAIGTGTFDDSVRGQQVQAFSDQTLTSMADTLASGYGLLSGIGAANAESGELNDLFEMLSSRNNYDTLADQDVAEIMGSFMNETGIDSGTLTRYFEDRLNAYDYGTAAGQTPSLGSGDAGSYVSPAEFRGRYFSTGG
ncbi:hypothetical protein SEA_BURRO_38 [Microbacterium phage Burro]|uniref:Uncharacterized protein n=1 Tax=Microbacterium phage Burro TaxID=2315703 RepID=A0A386KP28_9CAUD|nr:hypothetical protein HWB89_gp38 [Microbacterium phage Burro]AYD86181.1 hypothetical protein SEA_BURRO_38 [Microbacterium phage Burro]